MRIVVAPDRRRHILDGDRTGGGHRGSEAAAGKSGFPAAWDDERIIAAVEEVANDPAARRGHAARGRTIVYGAREDVRIAVVVGGDGLSVVTAFPLPAT